KTPQDFSSKSIGQQPQKGRLPMKLGDFTERFVQERRILNNVSPATIQWYRYSLRAFQPVLEAEFESIGLFKAAVIKRIGELQTQSRGNKAVSINTYLRCLKAFMQWCFQEGIVSEPFKLAWLIEEEKILATFSQLHVKQLVHWKPVNSIADIDDTGDRE